MAAVAAILENGRQQTPQKTPRSWIKFAAEGFSECLLNDVNQDMQDSSYSHSGRCC